MVAVFNRLSLVLSLASLFAVSCNFRVEELYTTASLLNIREQPSSEAKKVSAIPYGTKISVRRTRVKETIEGKSNYWFSLENGGYVFC